MVLKPLLVRTGERPYIVFSESTGRGTPDYFCLKKTNLVQYYVRMRAW